MFLVRPVSHVLSVHFSLCVMHFFPRADANHSVSFWKYFTLFIISISIALTS